MNIKLGRESFSIQVTRAKNSVAEPLPDHGLPTKVMSVGPFESPKSSLKRDAELFMDEIDNLGGRPSQGGSVNTTSVELMPLPTGLCYAFLNGDTQTPIISSDKLNNQETAKLITILDKHRMIFGYSLQDLKGISPTLCTHRIPIDPSRTPT
jgi:hypothetical protein